MICEFLTVIKMKYIVLLRDAVESGILQQNFGEKCGIHLQESGVLQNGGITVLRFTITYLANYTASH